MKRSTDLVVMLLCSLMIAGCMNGTPEAEGQTETSGQSDSTGQTATSTPAAGTTIVNNYYEVVEENPIMQTDGSVTTCTKYFDLHPTYCEEKKQIWLTTNGSTGVELVSVWGGGTIESSCSGVLGGNNYSIGYGMMLANDGTTCEHFLISKGWQENVSSGGPFGIGSITDEVTHNASDFAYSVLYRLHDVKNV